MIENEEFVANHEHLSFQYTRIYSSTIIDDAKRGIRRRRGTSFKDRPWKSTSQLPTRLRRHGCHERRGNDHYIVISRFEPRKNPRGCYRGKRATIRGWEKYRQASRKSVCKNGGRDLATIKRRQAETLNGRTGSIGQLRPGGPTVMT